MQQQNSADLFASELKKSLTEINFDGEISYQVRGLLPTALSAESMASIGCNYETLVLLFESVNAEKINLYLLSFYINIMQNKSIKDFNQIDVETYLAVQKQINGLAEEWNKLVQPIKERITRKIHAEANMKGRILPATSKHSLRN